MSRDIVDIAFMVSHWGEIPKNAFEIAENAYGGIIRKNLVNAVMLLQKDVIYRRRCIDALDISDKERLQAGVDIIGKQMSI